MDVLSRHFYDLKFKVEFMEKTANAFQDFFADIMEKRHPGDFIRSRTWGALGDRSNDGYLASQRALFACYAPHEMTSRACVSKVNSDLDGALNYWREHFDRWVFVHNDRQGLGPEVTRRLLELRESHSNLEIVIWGFEEVRQQVFALRDLDLETLLGPAPTRGTMMDLGLEDLAPVLDQISGLARPTGELMVVPSNKLDHNQFSEAAATLINAGLQRSPLVRKYFTRHPRLRDQLAARFSEEYRNHRDAHLSPDMILAELQRFAGGDRVGDPKRQAAVLASVAFFFEECDVFERPPGES